MKITKENYDELINKALERAIKKGFKRKMNGYEILNDVQFYDFFNETHAIKYLTDYLMGAEKICRMIDEGKLKEFEVKATGGCIW